MVLQGWGGSREIEDGAEKKREEGMRIDILEECNVGSCRDG